MTIDAGIPAGRAASPGSSGGHDEGRSWSRWADQDWGRNRFKTGEMRILAVYITLP